MSTSLQEMANESDRRARAMRAVLDRFPNATPESLWDGGPLVPFCASDDARREAREIDVVMCNSVPSFLLYLTIKVPPAPGVEDEVPSSVRVYAGREAWRPSSSWYSAIQNLSEQGRALLIEAIRGAR